jgi:hypothetical protein
MANRKKIGIVSLSFISIIFALYTLGYNIDTIEKKTDKFNDCTEIKKNLEKNAEELDHLSSSYQKNELLYQHNLNVAKFNGMCNGEIR